MLSWYEGDITEALVHLFPAVDFKPKSFNELYVDYYICYFFFCSSPKFTQDDLKCKLQYCCTLVLHIKCSNNLWGDFPEANIRKKVHYCMGKLISSFVIFQHCTSSLVKIRNERQKRRVKKLFIPL